jgi:hypothetical protein
MLILLHIPHRLELPAPLFLAQLDQSESDSCQRGFLADFDVRDKFVLGLCASSCEFSISKCIIIQIGGLSFGGQAKLGTSFVLAVMNKQIDQQNNHDNSDNHTNDN